MRRPSHFMLAALALFGAVLALYPDELVPEESAYAKKQKEARRQRSLARARIVDPGRGDYLPATARQRSESRAGGTKDRNTKDLTAKSTQGPWSLRGLIRLESGQAADGITIPVDLELVPIGDGPHSARGLQSQSCTSNGTYEIDGLLPGLYRLRALPRFPTQVEAELAQKLRDRALPIAFDLRLEELPQSEADAGRLYEHDIVLPKPRLLSGRLLAKRPSATKGMQISVTETGLNRGSAFADLKGSFAIPAVGQGPYEFQVRSPSGDPVKVERIEVKHGESIEVALSLDP